jgi:cation diffusion facilitator CzcD-associated flavoprotein CzcO
VGERVETDLTRDGWTSTARLQRKMISGALDTSMSPEERERIDELVDAQKMNQIRARVDEVVEDPATAEVLKPWYRYMCKRPCFSDHYLQTFNRPNVTLVDTADHGGITRMTEDSVVVGETEYPVDCVVFATGFDVGVSGVMSGTMPVSGRGGQDLLASWSRGPRTLHGFYSDGFPNFFQLGAVQNANSVNFAHILLEQAGHIAAVIAQGRKDGAHVVEPSKEAVEEWVRTVRETAHDNSAFQAECTPGYYNREGAGIHGGFSYSPGPVSFHRLLADWRGDRMHEVLGTRS